MPKSFRKKPRYRNRRKKYNKRTRITTAVIKAPSGIADRLMTKLKYSEQISLVSAGLNRYVFSGNSLFDPNVTGGGHQPRFFDEYSTLYLRYRVHASKINIKIVNADTAVGGVGLFPLTQSSSVTPVSVIADCQEMPYAKFRWMASSSDQVVSMSSYQTTRSMRGESDTDDDYSALITANPVKQWYWHIIGAQADSISTPQLTCIVQIEYWCEFLRRRAVVQS